MNNIKLFLISTLALVGMFSSCHEEKDPDPVPVAMSFLYALHQGDYAKAASLTLMIDSAPKDYKNLIATRYKEIASDHQEQYGAIVDVKCKQVDISDNKNEADVLLTIKYSNHFSSNVLLQLSKDKQEWKIR